MTLNEFGSVGDANQEVNLQSFNLLLSIHDETPLNSESKSDDFNKL